ncbi:unnamed protein product [Rhodiola kirilowii]
MWYCSGTLAWVSATCQQPLTTVSLDVKSQNYPRLQKSLSWQLPTVVAKCVEPVAACAAFKRVRGSTINVPLYLRRLSPLLHVSDALAAASYAALDKMEANEPTALILVFTLWLFHVCPCKKALAISMVLI